MQLSYSCLYRYLFWILYFIDWIVFPLAVITWSQHIHHTGHLGHFKLLDTIGALHLNRIISTFYNRSSRQPKVKIRETAKSANGLTSSRLQQHILVWTLTDWWTAQRFLARYKDFSLVEMSWVAWFCGLACLVRINWLYY